MPEQQPTITIEDAVLIYKNFKGKIEQPYNPLGKKTFGVIITHEIAEALLNDGWNVKFLNPREEGDVPTPFLPVEARFDIRAPRVTLITSNGRKLLDQDTIGVLDDLDFTTVDLICRAHDWTQPGGKSGRKAYLATMYATMMEDELDRKYSSAQSDEKGDGD